MKLAWLAALMCVAACSSVGIENQPDASIDGGSSPDASFDAGSPDATPGGMGFKILASFDGTSGPGYKDHPDTGGAVGPNHVVDMVGSAFTVRDKTNGNVVQTMTQSAFWTSAGVVTTTLNDPRIVYDPLASRWYAVTAGPYAFLAISADANPTHAWKAVTLSTAVSGDLLERPGFDKNGVYVCNYGGNTDSVCHAIPKADLLWTGNASPSLAHINTFTNLAFELVPAVDLDPNKAANAPEVVITRQGGQNQTNVPFVIVMHKITWAKGDGGMIASIDTAQNIPTSLTYTTPGNSLQPSNPPIRGVEDHRFFNVFAASGSVFAATGTLANARTAIAWFEIAVSDGSVVQEALLGDATYDALFPTLAVDAADNLAIGFTKTSATEYPSVYVAYRYGNDPKSTLRTPALGKAGTTTYACSATPVGWGTYSATAMDPSSPLVFWTYQEYAASATSCQWMTRWVSFSL